jgi:CHASE3 domain sensor protein/class 3 adenylate cyclase
MMKLSIQRKIILGFGLTSSLIILVSSIGYYSAFRLRDTNQKELHAKKVLTKLEKVLAEITDAETGQRGYLLTGKPRYLDPYKKAVDQVEDDIKQLQMLTAKNPDHQKNLERAIPLINQKFAELQQTIHLRNEQGLDAALEIVNTNQGKLLMDQIREIFHQMKAEEERLFQVRSQSTQSTVHTTIWIFSIGLAFDLSLLVFVYSHIYREINQRLQAQDQLRDSESRLTQFLEAIPVGVFVVDHNSIPYYANQTAKKLFGQGLIPTNPTNRLPEIYPIYSPEAEKVYPGNLEPIIQALNGKSSIHDGIEIHQPDKIVPIEVLGTPIFDDKGNVSYAIVVLNDITERQRSESERLRFTGHLNQLNQAFSRFVPGQFLQLLNKETIVDVELGDQVEKEMSVLFSDIRDFTALSEGMTPEENFKFINSYLSRMEPTIIKNKGFIDKYIGDAIMALFSGGADDAVKAGIAMLHQLTEYNRHRANCNYRAIQLGMGINTGTLMLGTVGGYNRMDTTVISDAVNLAARLEGLTKNYGVSLLISHHTFKQLQNPYDYAIRMIDHVKVKGKSELVTVYEIFDADLPEVREAKLDNQDRFALALSLYNQQAYAEALRLFEACLHQNPADQVAQIYQQRCHLNSNTNSV